MHKLLESNILSLYGSRNWCCHLWQGFVPNSLICDLAIPGSTIYHFSSTSIVRISCVQAAQQDGSLMDYSRMKTGAIEVCVWWKCLGTINK